MNNFLRVRILSFHICGTHEYTNSKENPLDSTFKTESIETEGTWLAPDDCGYNTRMYSSRLHLRDEERLMVNCTKCISRRKLFLGAICVFFIDHQLFIMMHTLHAGTAVLEKLSLPSYGNEDLTFAFISLSSGILRSFASLENIYLRFILCALVGRFVCNNLFIHNICANSNDAHILLQTLLQRSREAINYST